LNQTSICSFLFSSFISDSLTLTLLMSSVGGHDFSHNSADWSWCWGQGLLGELDVARVWGQWLDGVSWVPSTGGVWGWGHRVVNVVVVVVWCLWVVSKSGLGSGDITGGGVWSSGNWVGVVMWDGGDLLLVAWGTGWAILWSVGSIAVWDSAVDSTWTVVSVAWWEGCGDGCDKGNKGEFHYFYNYKQTSSNIK
jgi:hypothetical protein